MKKGNIAACCIIISLYAFLYLVGITCPIKYTTGISCPGCGMTRAWISLLRGDVGKAFYYHPLFMFPLIWAVVYLVRNKLSKKFIDAVIWISIILFIIVYIIRMIYGDGYIVQFNPQNGIIFRLLN